MLAAYLLCALGLLVAFGFPPLYFVGMLMLAAGGMLLLASGVSRIRDRKREYARSRGRPGVPRGCAEGTNAGLGCGSCGCETIRGRAGND